MNRETESHFSLLPTVEKPRSIFDRGSQIKTSFNAGELIPVITYQDVMPGDTIQMSMAEVIRLVSQQLKPPMDNMYLDIFWMMVPSRLVMDEFKEFMGENNDPWIVNQEDKKILTITAPENGWAQGTIADYMGLPTKIGNIEVSRLAFNAYCKIYNDHFRDQNVEYALDFDTKTQTKIGSNGTTAVTDCALGGMPAKVNKFHDYFTSCLPGPLRHSPVTLPLGNTAPVKQITNPTTTDLISPYWYNVTNAQQSNLQTLTTSNGNYGTQGMNTTANTQTNLGIALQTDLSNATAATITQLYQAFALQSLYQAEARSGARLNEIIYGHFGVKSPDARLQRSEYLGGKRIALNSQQVADTANNLADLASFSHTTDKEEDVFTYSATEWGILMCLACVRAEHSYQQGIEREWSRFYKIDYYFPELANLAESLVLNKEIYATGTNTDNEGFGYQEAWADYRYKPSRVTGQMRSNAQGTLDIYHYADNYASLPYLSPEWMEEPKTNIDRTLAVTSETSNQFIADFFFDTKWTREMPMYSIPGMPQA